MPEHQLRHSVAAETQQQHNIAQQKEKAPSFFVCLSSVSPWCQHFDIE